MSTEIIQITKANAMKAFKTADSKGKALLTDLLAPFKLDGKITDRVKTFPDACDVLGIDLLNFNLKSTVVPHTPDEIAYKKLKIICEALNEGWTPDWSDSNQPKYFPWFRCSSGVGFSNSHYGCWLADTSVGSRLCFKSSDLAEYAGKQFESEYNVFLSI